jgi:hypothetical protein
LRQREREIDGLGLRVAVVSFESREVAAVYLRNTDLRWPLLLDPSRALYTAYGMGRGTFWQIWGPATWWAYAKLLARGRRPAPATGDIDQLGGNVLIDPSGRVVIHHLGSGPADRPSIDAMLAPVRNSMDAPGHRRV